MRKQYYIPLLCILFCMLLGCSNNPQLQSKDAEDNSNSEETEEDIFEETLSADGFEILGGLWEVGGLYYNNNVVDIHDNSALNDLYNSVYLTFKRNGNFTYINGFIYGGEYLRSTSNKDTYILTINEKEYLKDNNIVKENVSKKLKYLVTIIDENTFRFSEYDSITGEEKAKENPLIFTKKDKINSFINSNKIELHEYTNHSSQNEKDVNTTSSNSYSEILNIYTEKMKQALPNLIEDYKSTSSGVYDIDALAEICNDNVSKLADICNEGIGLMADLMYAKGDSYETYEKWAQKLMDNYTDIAMEIMDAYVDSAIF